MYPTILAIAFSLLIGTASAETYKYEPSVATLKGRLVSAPGESPDGKKITFPALQLSTPITVQGLEDTPTEKGVMLLHLSLSPKMMGDFNRLKGKKAAVTGSLFHADNGNHQTNVLISPASITFVE